MATLETIVPDLELCVLIPDGKFNESALVWSRTFRPYHEGDVTVVENVCQRAMKHLQVTQYVSRQEVHPAPTLAEVLADLPPGATGFCTIQDTQSNYAGCKIDTSIQFAADDAYELEDFDQNPANAALRLWLKLKGI